MKRFIVLTAFLSFSFLVYSQISFEKSLDIGFNDSDEAWSVVQTSDGGYVVSGATWTSDENWFDMAMMKINQNGEMIWTKTYGVGMMSLEVAYSIDVTTDGGFIIVGGTDGFTGDNDFWIIRTDENGDSLWSKTYGGDNQEYAHSVIQTDDGGFIIAGETNSFGAGSDDIYVVKTDANGEEQWSQTYGTENPDGAFCIRQTTDGGYIIGGSTNGYMDGYVVKIDANGALEWEKSFGGPITDEIFSIKQTDDGGYIAAGATMSIGAGNYDFWLLKLNATGELTWEKAYGGTEKDKAWGIAISNDGGYVLAGFSESFHQAEEDEGVYMIKTNINGDTLWTRTYGNDHNDGAQAVISTDDGGFLMAGYNYVSGESNNFYLIKTHSNGTVGVDEPGNKVTLLDIYPNPFRTFATLNFPNPANITFNLVITNTSGTIVRKRDNISGDKVVIEKGDLPPGIYFVELKGDRVFRSKIIVN
jgi:hypothetical protein